jgi:hypothetical protein
MSIKDKILGMLKAHAYGDAFGAAYEFRPRPTFSNNIEHKVHIPRRFQDDIYLPVGSVTDDTQMTYALLSSVCNQDYDLDTVIIAYNTWAKTAVCCGRNTQELFKFKVKPENVVASFMRRWKAQETRSQSNGSLMRCSVLALLPENTWVKDCNLTNPTLLNRTCNKIYLKALRSLLKNEDIKTIYRSALRAAHAIPALKPNVIRINKKEPLDVSKNRGWVLHAFSLALETLRYLAETPKNQVSLLYIHQQVKTHIDGDTDTNAAISAALIGAYLGHDKLVKNNTVADNMAKILMPDYNIDQYLIKHLV